MQPFMRQPPRLYEPTQSLRLRTIGHAALTALMPVFYPCGKKVLPETIANIMADPLAVAVWFMDDGNVKRNSDGDCVGYNLNTQSFTHQENTTIQRLFWDVCGIHASVEKNKGYFRIGMYQKESREKFRDLIKQHVIPSMQYKLGYVGDSLRTRRD